MANEEQWIESFYQENCGCALEDICGQHFWKQIMKGCICVKELDDLFDIRPSWGLFLCGEAGTGKSTLAQAFLGELEKAGYRVIYLRAADLLAETEQDLSRAAQLQEVCMREKTAVFLDDAEDLCDRIPVAEKLAEGFSMLKNHQCPVVWILAAADEKNIPPVLREQLLLCQIGLPDRREREEYFEAMLGKFIDSGVRCSAGNMAEMTEKFNYEQLSRIVDFAKNLLKQKALDQYHTIDKIQEAAKKGLIFIEREQFTLIVEKVRKKEIAKPMEMISGKIVMPAAMPSQPAIETAEGVSSGLDPISLDDELEMLDADNFKY